MEHLPSYTHETYPSPADPEIRHYLDTTVWSTEKLCSDDKQKEKRAFLWPHLRTISELIVPLWFMRQHFESQPTPMDPPPTNRFYMNKVRDHIQSKLQSPRMSGGWKAAMWTMAYMVRQLGDFVFYAIKDNKLVAFIRYFDPDWKNDWTRKFDGVDEVRSEIKKHGKEGLTVRGSEHWRPEGCSTWIRNTNVFAYKGFFTYMHLFLTLCETRKVPDSIGFINLYEQPLIRADGREPFRHYHLPQKMALTSPIFPIMSCEDLEGYLDLTIPVHDEWEHATHMYFRPNCRDVYIQPYEKVPWDEKIKTLFFRGAITGCFWDDRNMRIRLIKRSQEWEKDPRFNAQNPIDNVRFLDAKATHVSPWDTVECRGSCEGSDRSTFRVAPTDLRKLTDWKAAYVPQFKQSQYRFLLSIEGSVAPWREPYQLTSGSTLVRAETASKFWYEPIIEPLVHYVPLDHDLTKLAETCAWCKTHDEDCRQIARNAKDLYDTFLGREGCLDYMQILLCETSSLKLIQ